VVVTGVNIGFVVMALKTFPGEVSATPYEDGVAYNREVAQKQAQNALGWTAKLTVETQDRLALLIIDRAGAPVTGLDVAGTFERPATEVGRRQIKLADLGSGQYGVSTQGMRGAWDVRAVATDKSGRRFEVEDRIVLP